MLSTTHDGVSEPLLSSSNQLTDFLHDCCPKEASIEVCRLWFNISDMAETTVCRTAFKWLTAFPNLSTICTIQIPLFFALCKSYSSKSKDKNLDLQSFQWNCHTKTFVLTIYMDTVKCKAIVCGEPSLGYNNVCIRL